MSRVRWSEVGEREFLTTILAGGDAAPILRIVGRTLLHAASWGRPPG